ncbi:MAG: hypothetical protein WDN08_10675 [Rhizomicrobium sp.]
MNIFGRRGTHNGDEQWIALAAAFAACAPPAVAGPRDEVVDILVKCTDVADRDARIACYDQAAPQLRAAAQASPAAVNIATAPPSSAAPPPALAAPPPPAGSFLASLDPVQRRDAAAFRGADGLPADRAGDPADHHRRRRLHRRAKRRFSVTLENGQVWRERNEHYDTPPFKAGGKNTVMIEHGVLGGYNLYLKGYGKIYKVKRVK